MRKIFIGADSAGFPLKEKLIPHLKELGYEVTDLGTNSTASCHYPDFAAAVCKSVQSDLEGSFGILVCGTGIGMSMCANKYRGIRAAVCSDTYSAKMTRAHNDANVLCLGARVIGECLAEEILDAFLSAEFEGGRHKTRVDMMSEIEDGRK
ncbi:MAG: ribose 5-phosphate isomerase B [Clostridia bacterium]|nr:ribose 5-phosphate isomerase B [Clostridia bacterium]MBR3681615.1 ribose 5-phosphate isomerase B [Clostridia bacterium]